MKSKFTLCALLLCCAALPAFADDQHSHEMTVQELGAVSFPISCNAASQTPFNTGVAWLHSFEYEQARGEFAKLAIADPKCAMAYWGQAMSLFHQLWEHPDADATKIASAMLGQAKKLKASPREQAYIAALSNTFTSDDPKTFDDR